MQLPLFSIIIPTLNEEDYIPLLLTDFTKQYKKNFEVIVVDGHSDDTTEKKVNHFSKKLPLTFLSVKKRKLAYQRNIGAAKAKGKWLIFLDADSRITSRFTVALEEAAAKHSKPILIPYMVPDSAASRHKIIFSIMNTIIEASLMTTRPFCTPGAFCIRKDAFWKVGGYDEQLFMSEDHNFIQRSAKMKIKGKMVRNARVKFSFRRYKSEGELQVLYKYITVFLHTLMKGDVRDEIISYEMGGTYHKNYPKTSKRYTMKVKEFMKGFASLTQ